MTRPAAPTSILPGDGCGVGWAGGPGRDWRAAPRISASGSSHIYVHRWEHSVKANPGWKKKKKAKREVFAVPWAAVQTTPNTQPLNKQGDSISEVELNSFKQFSGKKKKRGSKLKPFRDYSEEFIYCVFSIKDIWKSESYTHYSWPVLKFKNDGGGGANDIVLSRQKDASTPSHHDCHSNLIWQIHRHWISSWWRKTKRLIFVDVAFI